MSSSILRFDRFELDPTRGVLREAGRDTELPRLSQRLLGYLVANRDRVVPFDEVREEVWEGVAVGEAAVHQALRQVRRALGDDAREQRFIRTVRGVGYRFVAPVRAEPGAAPLDAYVGRPKVLDELRGHLDRALAGRGGAVLVSGEPGVGKTRTVEEILHAAEARGALVLRAGGTALGGAPPFWPWLPLFEQLAARRPVGELRREIQQLAPGFAAPDGPGSPTARLDDVSRFRFFDAAARCLERAGGLGPLVVFIDDLHEVGGAALELLEYLSHGIGTSPILVLGAYRPEEALSSPERARPLARAVQLPTVSAVALGPLEPQELAALVLEHDPPTRSPGFLELLTRCTEGNPFYAIELVRFLGASLGGADPAGVDWEGRIPQGIQQILGERLAGLTEPAQRVLGVYACLGGEFDPELVARVEEGVDVDSALAEARAVGLVRGAADAPRFSHPLVREAILARQVRDADARRRLHLRLAEAIEARSPERIQEIAFHAAEAAPLGSIERAVALLRGAGEQAERLFDDEGAWEAYRKALQLLDRWPVEDEVLRCEILIAAGEVAVRGTRTDEARGILREATAIARRLGQAALFCRAALAFAYRDEVVGVPEGDVAELLEEALGMDAALPDALRSRLLSGLALKIHYRPGALARTNALVDESIALARRSGDAGSRAQVLEDASFVRWSVADPEGWIALNRGIVEAASEARDVGLVFRGVKGLGTGHMEVGDRDAMEREFRRCAALAQDTPAPYLRAVATLQRGGLAFLDGRFAQGEACGLEAMQSGLPAITPLASVQLYYHRLETGRIAELEAAVRSLVEGSPGIGAWRFALARLLTALGRSDEAEHQLALAGSVAELARDRTWLAAAALGAEALAELGDRAGSEALFALLEPHARVNNALGHGSLFYGNTSHHLGLLAMTAGRNDEAEALLDAARAMHARMRSRPWILRTRLARAENLAARGEEATAREQAASVAEEADALGMVRLAGSARSLAPGG